MLDSNFNVKLIDFGDARKVVEEVEDDEDNMHQGRRDTFVGTVNYQAPEVINSEQQGCELDIWALGCILFKMFVGTVPFKGTNPMSVYKDVKERNIQWPSNADQLMSPEAMDLINRMIQISPKNRLGHDLESLKVLKTHPFFNGVDFAEVSKHGYSGIKPLVDKVMPTKFDNQEMNDVDRQSLNNIRGMGNGFNPLADENAVVFKGNLCKKNWYGNKQLRFFELYRYGELKYYKDMKDYKGSITLGPDSRVLKMNRTTIKVYCEKKQKDYILV